MRTFHNGWLVGLAVLAAPAHARTIEYCLDLAAIEAAAADQGIEGPFSPQPSLGKLTIALVVDPSINHIMKNLSIYCDVYKVENPLGQLMQSLVASPKAENTIYVSPKTKTIWFFVGYASPTVSISAASSASFGVFPAHSTNWNTG